MLEQDKSAKKDFVINEDIVKGKWKDVKGEVRKLWGKITDDELEQTKGDLTSIAGLIQQRYGETKESVHDKMNKLFSGFEDTVEATKNTFEKVTDKVQSTVADAAETVKKKLS
ncbi:MAG: CsbD family protein [Bacteriovoracaceae bacterium]|jgi:uncharacterized protein YjbJ (UPF0337 family)